MHFVRAAFIQVAALAIAGPALAQGSDSRGAFVVTLGRDTMVVESFVRAGNRLEGDMVTRQPSTVLTHYVITIGADGRPRTMELSQRRGDGSALPNAPQRVLATYSGDSVVSEITRGDSTVRRATAAKDGYPYLSNSFAMYELALAGVRARGTDSTEVTFVQAGGRSGVAYPTRIVSPTSARLYYFGAPQYVTLDAQGRILTVDATATSSKVSARRVSSVDIAAVAARFARADAAGHGLGSQSSPRDTAKATVGSAGIWVDYGRPSLRGRDVWKNGVLGDTLWRTGANAATQLHTDVDLTIAGKVVPAGTYTLYTHTIRDGARYELAINRQTGQWGTEYHADRDLVRVPLTVGTLASPVEQFTIVVEPGGGSNGGTLRLQWGLQELSVPFTTK